ncbi:hypothetical protein SAMN05216593_108212 [Pseudomonas asturiensis]|uniref:Uncharacterized protein n=1 Tax=Pseudomonas asturiensis TaxID=1190415 RepID=A0A1M7P8N7_9PSED|nr:hypothetical protein [Pseudomonas asturiensis]SHN12587.1 hypothetical protein SAMN05216593_108212 [Pseudomonas asturiensis]
MLESTHSNITLILSKISKIGSRCGIMLIVCYVVLSLMSAYMDPNFDQHRLAEDFAPFIIFAIGVNVVCQLVIMMIRTKANSD